MEICGVTMHKYKSQRTKNSSQNLVFVLLNAINIHDEIHEIHVGKFKYIHLILSFKDVKVKIVLNRS